MASDTSSQEMDEKTAISEVFTQETVEAVTYHSRKHCSPVPLGVLGFGLSTVHPPLFFFT